MIDDIIDNLPPEEGGEPEVSVDAIKFKIENFEGPLDLLLHLIRGTKLDIKSVKLAEITDQYLSYMSQIKDVDMERASEFIEVAATLLEIKSRSVLPRQEELVEDEEDPAEALKRRLEEYKLFKEASIGLAEIENVDRFYKPPEKSAGDYRIVLKDMNMDGLIAAFSSLLCKLDIETKLEVERKIVKDRFTLKDKIDGLRAKLTDERKVKFFSLFDSDFTRGEVITTFLAVLELLKAQFAQAEQGETFGDIDITFKEGGEHEITELTADY
ncbi:MAG: segregation/condensation protein A [Firmicutes bacterium]|nr:segregation/condensation protein A [Bacillota bacterium]